MRELKTDDVYVNVDERTGIATYHIANTLPSTIKGLVCEDCGEPFIVINANCSYDEQKAAYKHEQKHILQDDFHTDVCADDLEKERH